MKEKRKMRNKSFQVLSNKDRIKRKVNKINIKISLSI